MPLDATLPYDSPLKNIPAAAQAAELLGFSGLWTAETQHDPFLPGPLIAEHTTPQEHEFVRQQIAFYASTPSYRAVMALHGWDATAATLSELASRGKWEAMPSLISPEMLDTFAVLAEPEHLAAALKSCYNANSPLADRLTPYLPFIPGARDTFWQSLARAFRDEGMSNE
jgi:alkanesulfonate monooxygenase SsuD/methylene tetrahydromethanopterin reductase-like flavin-dependent oxidoreductase (luciferase family)